MRFGKLISICIAYLIFASNSNASLRSNSLDLRADINRDMVPKLQNAFERYLPQVEISDGYKLGFAGKYKLSKNKLESFLNWVLPAREGFTITLAGKPKPRQEEIIATHNDEIVVIGEPVEEENGDTSLDLEIKLSNNPGFRQWIETPANGRKKTLLVPFADVRRGHWVLFTLRNNGKENSLQFVDTKFKVPYFQSIAKRAKTAFFHAVAAKVENPIMLPSLYLSSQNMLDRTSCGFQVIAMILQISDHSEKAIHKANRPLVISTIPNRDQAELPYLDAMRDPYSNFIKGFTPASLGNLDFDDFEEGTLSTTTDDTDF